jgi:hypothetical protein
MCKLYGRESIRQPLSTKIWLIQKVLNFGESWKIYSLSDIYLYDTISYLRSTYKLLKSFGIALSFQKREREREREIFQEFNY